MVNVVVGKIPSGVKLHKFMNFLKGVIFRCKKDMHVNYYRPGLDGFRIVSFSTTYKKALKAKKKLDGFQYIYARKPYSLECWLENMEEDEIECKPYVENNVQQEWNADGHDDAEYEPPQKSRCYSIRNPVQSSSLSPDNVNKLNAIKLKIELIKKERILLEEETKLLLEKKKLEFLQKMGPNDYGNLAKFEEVCKQNDVNQISDFLQSEQFSKPVPTSVPKQKLPRFAGPCFEIIGEMETLINSHGEITLENRSLFYDLLRTTLKKRLAIILENRMHLPKRDVINLYRAQHPIETDANLVAELLNTIKTCCLTEEPMRKSDFVPANVGGQTTEAQMPPAGTVNTFSMDIPQDTQETPKLDLTADDDDDPPTDAGQIIEFDEYVDMEKDLENWIEDDENEEGDAKDGEDQSVTIAKEVTADDEVPERKEAEERKEENGEGEDKAVDDAVNPD